MVGLSTSDSSKCTGPALRELKRKKIRCKKCKFGLRLPERLRPKASGGDLGPVLERPAIPFAISSVMSSVGFAAVWAVLKKLRELAAALNNKYGDFKSGSLRPIRSLPSHPDAISR